MHKQARSMISGVAAVLILPAMAQAQEGQTPQNAQAFLAKVVAAGGVEVTAKTGSLDYGYGDFFNSSAVVFYPFGSVRAAAMQPTSDGKACTTTMDVYGKLGATRRNNAGGISRGMNALWSLFFPKDAVGQMDPRYDYAFANGTGTILWRQVSKVEVAGNLVTLPITYAGGGVRFRFPTEELAKRVGFAMEVIRVACDATSDANF